FGPHRAPVRQDRPGFLEALSAEQSAGHSFDRVNVFRIVQRGRAEMDLGLLSRTIGVKLPNPEPGTGAQGERSRDAAEPAPAPRNRADLAWLVRRWIRWHV